MKTIISIIPPHALSSVRQALLELGIVGLTVTDVKGYGMEHGFIERYRGMDYRLDFSPQVKLEILQGDDGVERVIETILGIVRSGPVADGRIYLLDAPHVHRVRTGETGEAAV